MLNLWSRILPLGFTLLSLTRSACADRADWPELVLDERVLRFSYIAANLSALAYADAATIEQWAIVDNTTGETTYNHPDYEYIQFYNDEPDQAIVAKQEGRCYISFRGTNADIDDWLQNAGLGDINVYKDNEVSDTSTEFCEGRGGFGDFLMTDAAVRGRADVQACVETCQDPDDCLVITGHSQGGATSTIAAITLFSLKPILVTFGQPPTIDPDCPFVDNSRFYRYVNWLQDEGQDNDIGFDLVVYAPNWISGSVHYGFNILVGEDPANVYVGGYGNDIEFFPSRFDNKAAAHTMSEAPFSYQSRIKNLLANFENGAIGTDGSIEGTICKDAYMDMCQSKRCVEFQCIPIGGVEDTCIIGSCEADEDCAGDLVCVWDSCATAEDQVAEGCPCSFSRQCANNDCVTINVLALDFRCNDPDNPGGSAASAIEWWTTLGMVGFVVVVQIVLV